MFHLVGDVRESAGRGQVPARWANDRDSGARPQRHASVRGCSRTCSLVVFFPEDQVLEDGDEALASGVSSWAGLIIPR